MTELVEKLKKIKRLAELDDLNKINRNMLLYAIIKSDRYDLINGESISVDCDDKKTLEKLIDDFMTYEDSLWFLFKNGFSFSKVELEKIFKMVCEKYYNDFKFDHFFSYFFQNKDELNNFISEHTDFLERYINDKKGHVAYVLYDCDSFVKFVLAHGYVNLVKNLENYSADHLKILANLLKQNKKISGGQADDRFANHLFELKNEFELDEFYELLGTFDDPYEYERKVRNSELSSFTLLIKNNIDYLIDVVTNKKVMPKCLALSDIFRDECIKRNRIDLAVKCLLPLNISDNEKLAIAYSQELNISLDDFKKRYKWVLDYYKRNNNIFNSLLATSLKDNIINFSKEHYEKFINDVDIQLLLVKLNDKELTILSKILDNYNYKDYEITEMVFRMISNINDYHELIESLSFDSLDDEILKSLVCVLQFSGNPYEIKDVASLKKLDEIKRDSFLNNYSSNLESKKDNLLKAIFNIDLDEAVYINSKYSCDKENNSILDKLKDSELPLQVYNYLLLINKILECKDFSELLDMYNNLDESFFYKSEIPLEIYLRSKYTELYSNSLFKINDKENVYGPRDSVFYKVNYNGKEIKVCVPMVNFNFFVHCVGSCTLASEVSATNYRNDWLDRPQIQDHFVACSYINERGIYSIRAQGNIIFGFDSLEGGAIHAMGDTDIDSIGNYARAYAGGRKLQAGLSARYFVPSEILKSINSGYNEIVIERRNNDRNKGTEFKRKPDYIIMMAESIDGGSLKSLDDLLEEQLPFITDEDKELIRKAGNKSQLKGIINNYKVVLSQLAEENNINYNDLVTKYINSITEAKYFEDCLKASSEFDIPLVIIDKIYYFNKILAESEAYDDEAKKRILDFYMQTSFDKKRQLFDRVAAKKDISYLLVPTNDSNQIILNF